MTSQFLPIEISRKSEYVLLALLELANHYHIGKPLQVRQIAAQQHIPERYLEQIVALLKRGGLINSQRGAKGGYVLVRSPSKITLLDALVCTQGIEVAAAVQTPTPKTVETNLLQEIWQQASQAANSVWQKYTLQDLYERQKARRQLELTYHI